MTTAMGRKAMRRMRALWRIVLNQMQIVASVLASIAWSPELPPFLVDLVNFLRRVFTLDVPGLLTSPDCAFGSTSDDSAARGEFRTSGAVARPSL